MALQIVSERALVAGNWRLNGIRGSATRLRLVTDRLAGQEMNNGLAVLLRTLVGCASTSTLKRLVESRKGLRHRTDTRLAGG